MLRKCFLKIKSEMKHFCERVNKFYLSLICFILYSPFAFADFANLGNQVKGELKNTASTVMGVLNTVVASVGIVYVCIVGFIFIFKPDTFKENSKVLIGALVALGALYGITNLGQRAFID